MNRNNETSWLELAIDHSMLLFYSAGNDFGFICTWKSPICYNHGNYDFHSNAVLYEQKKS